MHKLTMSAFGAALMLFATPLQAQQSSYKLGSMWTASRIAVADGQFENYLDFLTSTWRGNQEFAKSKGWLLDYHILNSVNPRDGEPDIILLTRFADMPTAAEIERRDKLINARMKQDEHSAETASGQRQVMRKLMGTVLYRELKPR